MICDYKAILEMPPFGIGQQEKEKFFGMAMEALTEHHRKRCESYRRVTDFAGMSAPLPVRLFKKYDLLSVPKEEIIQVTTSSGTTGQAVSRVYLDRETSERQRSALVRIASDFIGDERLPMLVIDSSGVMNNRETLSARGAGILGFAIMGKGLTYALDENMELNMPAIEAFLSKHTGQKILMFGMTYIVWLHFCRALRQKNIRLDMKGFLIHGGGWKKLTDESVGKEQFKAAVFETTGVNRVFDYYGMVEQTGSVFMECEYGHFHASVFSDVHILHPGSMKSLEHGRGLIRSDSLLPTSYPGHRILNEDIGELLGIDECPCGRLGKFFQVYGRVQGAEVRGCSNSYERR